MKPDVVMDEAMIAALEEIDREFPNTPPVAPSRSMLYEIRLNVEIEDQRRRWLLGIRGGRPPGPAAAAQIANRQGWRNPATLVSDTDIRAMEALMGKHGR